MEMQVKVDDADKRVQATIQDDTKRSLDQLRAQVQLLQLQYAEINKQIQRR